MALVFTDLTKETTSTTGTGTLTLTGAVDKYQSFANIGTGNTTYYRIESGNDSEVGLGTYSGTLSRDTVYMSIIAGVAGTTKIDVATGATVSCVYPAEKAVVFDANDVLTIPDASAFKWSSDLTLYRDAANTIAQRNAANSQASRVYNTYSDASNYARASLSFVTYSGALYTKLAAESAGTGAANIGIALSPKGTGAITAQVPDGTVAGGNARGINAIDLGLSRSFASMVASGVNSIVIGNGGTASSSGSVSIGLNSKAEIGTNATALGPGSYASGGSSVSIGGGNAAGAYSVAIGVSAKTDKATQIAFASYSSGNQHSLLTLNAVTSNTVYTSVLMYLGGIGGNVLYIPNNTSWIVEVDVIGRSTSGTDNGYFKRRLMIKKGTTNASANFIPTGAAPIVVADMGSNAGAPPTGWAVSFTADTTNGALGVFVTGYSTADVQWVAKVSLVEVVYL